MPRTRIARLAAVAAMTFSASGVIAAVTPGRALATTVPQMQNAFASPFRVVPSPSPGRPYLYATTAISPTDVWAVGYDSSGTGHTLAEHWNGSVWRVVATPGSPTNLNFNALSGVSAVSSRDVWAIGNGGSTFQGRSSATFVEHWNGTAWSVVPTPAPVSTEPVLTSVVAISSTDVYAVGFDAGTTVNCNSYIPFVEHWNGTTWSIIRTVAPPCGATLAGVSASSSSDVWVVGSKEVLSGSNGFAEHFDGQTWRRVSYPNNANVQAVVALSPTDAWAVSLLIAHWNGTSWTTVPSSSAGGVVAITSLSPTDLWAVGSVNTTSPEHSFAEHYNGTAWSVVATPSPSGTTGQGDFLTGVSGVAGHLYAVGTDLPDNFTSKTLILENDKA